MSLRVLIVDDEPMNLDLMQEDLEGAGYETVEAENGEEAWALLQEDQQFEVILLDRMMPKMDGMEVLRRVRKEDSLKDIPVILQTAASASEQVVEGIEAGAYYYLTKPYSRELLLSIVDSAIQDKRTRDALIAETRKQKKLFGLMESSVFHFRTLSQAHDLAFLLANGFPEPERVITGLSELMVNAIEHGNLGISYEEKKQLLIHAGWQQEVERRLAHPEFRDKCATVRFRRAEKAVEVEIEDMGSGFDWQEYLEFSAKRATDPNGRGIAMARQMSFDEVAYEGKGNQVKIQVYSPQER